MTGRAGEPGPPPPAERDEKGALRELMRAVGLLSSQRVAVLVLGALRTKIAAAALGPGGIGLLAQALSLLELLRQVANVGTSRGFLKLVAEYRGRDDRAGLERLIGTATALVTGLAAAVAAGCWAFAGPLAERVFGSATHGPLVLLTAVSLVVAVPGAMAGRVLNGMLQLRSFAQLAIAQSAASVIAMAALVWAAGLDGAVAAIALAEAFGSALAVAVVHRRVARPLGLDLRPRRPDGAIARHLVRYAWALTATSLAATAGTLFVRSGILRWAGAEANGLYQVAWQVGQNYLAILAVSLWSYGMPKVASQLDDPEAIVALQNDFLRIALLVLAPGVVLLLVTRDVWIPLLYSEAFVAAGPLLGWQLAGELVAMVRQSMNVSLLPRERLGFLVAQGVGFWLAWALLSWLLFAHVGAIAAPVAYLVANVALAAVAYAYHRRRLGYRVRTENRCIAARTLPLLTVALALAQGDGVPLGRAAPLAILAAWGVLNRAFLVRLRAVV